MTDKAAILFCGFMSFVVRELYINGRVGYPFLDRLPCGVLVGCTAFLKTEIFCWDHHNYFSFCKTGMYATKKWNFQKQESTEKLRFEKWWENGVCCCTPWNRSQNEKRECIPLMFVLFGLG